MRSCWRVSCVRPTQTSTEALWQDLLCLKRGPVARTSRPASLPAQPGAAARGKPAAPGLPPSPRSAAARPTRTDGRQRPRAPPSSLPLQPTPSPRATATETASRGSPTPQRWVRPYREGRSGEGGGVAAPGTTAGSWMASDAQGARAMAGGRQRYPTPSYPPPLPPQPRNCRHPWSVRLPAGGAAQHPPPAPNLLFQPPTPCRRRIPTAIQTTATAADGRTWSSPIPPPSATHPTTALPQPHTLKRPAR